MWNYLREREKPVAFTRSRPYRKNDQAHVEQKNWTHVRQLVGYDRFENRDLVEPLNELYEKWGVLHNYFCPTMKLKEKSREGARVKRSYEKPKTPYRRLMESAHVKEEKKKELRKVMKGLDPFALKAQIEAQLRRIHSLNRGTESTIRVCSTTLTAQFAPGNTLP